MIDLVLVRKDILRYVQDVRTVRGMGRGLSDYHVVLCKIKLVGTWIKRSKVIVRARRIREDRYREGYTWSLEGKGVKEMEIKMSSICECR